MSRALDRLRSESGFTLVEVLVATVLVAIGLLAIMGTFDVSARAALFSQRHEQAVSIAVQSSSVSQVQTK